MERRSANRTTPRKRYTVDPFEGVPELQDAVAADEEDKSGGPVQEQDAESVDFQANTELPTGVDEDEDIMSGLEDEAAEVAEPSDAGDRHLDDEDSIIGGSDALQMTPSRKKRPPKRKNVPETEKLYTRGLTETFHNVAWPSRRVQLFGPLQEDSEPVLEAKVKWAADVTLPRRKADGKGLGGYHHSFYHGDAARTEEAKEGWRWYLKEGGKEAFGRRQVEQPITVDEAKAYMPKDIDTRSFVMGPVNDQKLYQLQVGQTVPLTEAWQTETPLPAEYKRGFMLNLGAKVQCLQWAPNQPGRNQYLTIAVIPDRSKDEQFGKSTAPAFTAQQPLKSSIQIWRFKADGNGYGDTGKHPQLETVLCTDWGDIKAFEWCQVPCDDEERLGLLGIVSGDGAIRVLEVPIPSDGDKTSFAHIETVAFECRPPVTLCTCLTWLSSTRIAAGCANGFVAVWDLPVSLNPEDSNPRPAIYSGISTSYILSIASCYPSRPHMLMTTSMTGYLTITDLKQPQPSSPAATAHSHRSRNGQPLLLWHDFAQCALSADELYTIRAYPVRRWLSTLWVGRAKSIGTAIAGSPCHPSVLLGTASGEVLATNPAAKITDNKTDTWQQTWFLHEWRRATEAEKATTGEDEMMADAQIGSTSSVGSNGLSRILEGFKAERVNLGIESKSLSNAKNGKVFHTIYEKETAITAVAWNPNLYVGGWAAAGMADGLVRVEDLGL